MKIALGLPSCVAGTDASTIAEWARRADDAGFDSLAVNERLAHDTMDPIVALTYAAASTSRVRLMTAVLLAAARPGPAFLAKQLATLDRLSEGRLSVGVGVGNRREEYELAGLPFTRRGRLLDACLDEFRRVWSGETHGVAGAIGPTPIQPGGPELLHAGYVPGAFKRLARFCDGWIAGSGSGPRFRALGEEVDQVWSEAGRLGRPRKLAQVHVALGGEAAERRRQHLADLYGYLGAELLKPRVEGLLTDDDRLQSKVAELDDAGCDEIILMPCVNDPDQVKRVAVAIASWLQGSPAP